MTLTASTRTRRPLRRRPDHPPAQAPRWGVSSVLSAEIFASVLGFAALIHQARGLGPAAFAGLEYAGAVFAWLLVLVRGGFDQIVYREAARRPRLIAPLTDLLIGLRLLAAAAGFTLVLLVAALVDPARGRGVMIAGLGLFASAWVADVGPRATNRLGWLALAQATRAAGYAAAVLFLVKGPGDALRAAACLLIAEIFGAAVPLAVHAHDHGFPRPRFRRRTSVALARRGAVAGLSRFARVTLYGIDLLALGWWAGDEIGPYAAARRLVFALVALGLVVPAVLGPSIARAWAAGSSSARQQIGAALTGLWSLSLPAAVGIAFTADRWMPTLFGSSYLGGGPWLTLVAARLPWLLAASFSQSALVACRREDLGLRVVLSQLALAAILIPASVYAAGPWGVGWAALGVETFGAVFGWAILARLGVAPSWPEQAGRALVGCLGLIAGCRLTSGAPLVVTCLAGAAGYGAAWRLASRWARQAHDFSGVRLS